MRSGTVAPEPLHHHGPVFDVQRRAASCGPDNLLPVPALGPRAPSGTVLVRLRYDCFAEFRRRRAHVRLVAKAVAGIARPVPQRRFLCAEAAAPTVTNEALRRPAGRLSSPTTEPFV